MLNADAFNTFSAKAHLKSEIDSLKNHINAYSNEALVA